MEKEKKYNSKLWEDLKEFIKALIIPVCVSWFVMSFLLINIIVPSGSMEPKIMTGSRIIGNRLTYKFGDPQRGDIAIFKYPDNESIYFIKRIVGMPGDTIEIIPDSDGKSSSLYINGEKAEETDTVQEMENQGYFKYEVPEDSYFMMGDNRNNSLDARYWETKYVKRDKILAKAEFQYWKGFRKL